MQLYRVAQSNKPVQLSAKVCVLLTLLREVAEYAHVSQKVLVRFILNRVFFRPIISFVFQDLNDFIPESLWNEFDIFVPNS